MVGSLSRGSVARKLAQVHPLLRPVAARQWGVFTAADSKRAGLGAEDIRSALRRGEWVRVRRGAYVERAVLEDAFRWGPAARHRLDCAAVFLALGGSPALSHASAARLSGLTVPRSASGDVVLTDEGQWRRGVDYAVMRARLPSHHVRSDGPFRFTTPARTLVDCAREWALEDSVVAMDAALHSRAVTSGELRAVVLEQTHWFGIGRAARAAGLADGRAESPLETRGRLRIIGSGLPTPELQVELRGSRGFLGRIDAWYEEAAVAVEFDGRVKYDAPFAGRSASDVLWEEKRREDAIRDVGVRMVRIVQADLGDDWPDTAGRLRAMLARPFSGPRRFTVIRSARPQRPTA